MSDNGPDCAPAFIVIALLGVGLAVLCCWELMLKLTEWMSEGSSAIPMR